MLALGFFIGGMVGFILGFMVAAAFVVAQESDQRAEWMIDADRGKWR